MVQRWAPAGLLAGALTLLAALYLPWQAPTCPSSLTGFYRCESVDGWTAGAGSQAALVAVVLAALAVASLVRRAAADVVLGACALTAGYFAAALTVGAPSVADREARVLHVRYHYAYGAYVGIAAAAVLVLFACATPLRGIVVRRPAHALAFLLGVALLVALLLPWSRFGGATTQGVFLPAGAVAAACASLAASAAWRPGAAAFGALVLVVTGGAVSSVTLPLERAYGAWVALGIAGAFAVLAIAAGWPPPLRVPRTALPATAAGALLVATLFLPWQRVCFAPADARFGGRCVSENGWSFTVGPLVAVLVLLIVLMPIALELTAALALIVATMGFGLFSGTTLGERFSFGYGAITAFVVAAALVAVVLSCVDFRAIGSDRIVDCAAPLLACAAYVALVVLPWWDVLPPNANRTLRFGPFSWLTIAGALVAIGLAGRWLRRLRLDRTSDPLLVALPLVLLALAALDLVRARDRGITWGGGVAVALCAFLGASGRIEQRGGLRSVQFPEILRVDRL